jgi:hypothetical protein
MPPIFLVLISAFIVENPVEKRLPESIQAAIFRRFYLFAQGYGLPLVEPLPHESRRRVPSSPVTYEDTPKILIEYVLQLQRRPSLDLGQFSIAWLVADVLARAHFDSDFAEADPVN